MKPPDKLELGLSRVVFAPMSSGSEDIISFYRELKRHYPRFSAWVRWGFFVGVQHPQEYKGLDEPTSRELETLLCQIDFPGLLVKESGEIVRVRAEDLRPKLEEAILKHTTISLHSPDEIIAALEGWLARCNEIYIHDAYLLRHCGKPRPPLRKFLNALRSLYGSETTGLRRITLLCPNVVNPRERPDDKKTREKEENDGGEKLEQLGVDVVRFNRGKDGLSHARWIYSPDGLCLFVDAGFDFLRDSTVLCCPPDPDTARRMLDFVKTYGFGR